MKHVSKIERIKPLTWWSGGILLVLAFGLMGCRRDNVKVYRLANDSSTQSASDMGASPAQAAGTGAPLTWTLPSGWEQKPASGMRVASFSVPGKDGQAVDVSVIPMPTGEPELDLVNMWRQQMQLPALTAETAGSEPESVKVGGDQGKLFEIASEQPILDGKSRARIIVAMVNHGRTSWFFKMSGPDALVREQKPTFIDFLKSVAIHSEGAPTEFASAHQFLSTNAKETRSENSEKPVWVVPPGWKDLPPSQFLLARFEVPGTGGANAEASVSMLGGTGGGLEANVTRWRGQIGLGPIDGDALNNLVTAIDTDGGKASLVDMTGTDPKSGQPVRLIAAVVPQAGQTWFYKLMGNAQVVQEQKDTFLKFVQTVKYSNAP